MTETQRPPPAEHQDGHLRSLDPQPAVVRPISPETTPDDDPEAQESTPLLGRTSSEVESVSPCARRRSWWTIASIAILLVLTINIIVFAFVVPSAAQSYASQATTYAIQNVQIENYTESGVIATAQVNVTIDASRVSSHGIRNLGVFATNIFKHIYTEPCTVSILLPQYNGAQVALAMLPALNIDIRNGHVNILDITSNVTVTDESLAVHLATDYFAGKRHKLETIGETDIHIKAGIIPLGWHHMRQEVIVRGNAPIMPDFTINQLNVVDQPGGTLMTASAQIANPYPVTLDIPALQWKVSVPGCTPDDHIRLTNARTEHLSLRAGHNITVNVSSSISSLPQHLLDPCSDTSPSPLEVLFQALFDPKQNTTIFISGSNQTSSLPKWLPGILSALTIPIPIPHLTGNTSDLLSSIHLSQMKLTLPPPWQPPGSPPAQPKISGLIEAIIRPPKEARDIAINVTAIKVDVFLFDQGDKFGRIVIPEWIPAITTRLEKIHVMARVVDVPVEILDPIVFQRVMGKVLQGGGILEIGVEGTVDGHVVVQIGQFTIRGVPVSGIVPVEGGYPFDSLKMALVGGIDVVDTTRDSITLGAMIEIDNPTEYEAVVPYLNLQLLYQGHLIGNATTENTTISKGTNKISGVVTYGPTTSLEIYYAEKFLGEYLSGRNPNITIRFHNSSIKGNPSLSKVLEGFNITLPVPSIRPDKPREKKNTSIFLRSATIHIISRTAQFELYNPLDNTEIIILSLIANATYDDENIGSIKQPDFNFSVLQGNKGTTTTDKIPVEVGSVGYDVIRRALGGELVIDAVADVVARIGLWRGRVRYHGEGLGTSVRL